MKAFHFSNLTPEDSLALPQIIQTLGSNWKNAAFKIDRILFKDGEICERIIKDYPLLLKNDENYSNEISLISGVDPLYKLDSFFDFLRSQSIAVRIEVLNSMKNSGKDILTTFLEDKYIDLHNKINFSSAFRDSSQSDSLTPILRFSLIQTEYEIDYVHLKSFRKKRTRKPPAPFQAIMKRKVPHFTAEMVGNEYYGRKIFKLMMRLLMNQYDQESENQYLTHIQLPLPPSPMKFFDMQEDQNDIVELRIPFYHSCESFPDFWKLIEPMIQSHDIAMIRLSIQFDAWSDTINFKHATQDQFLISVNDLELAFHQHNFPLLNVPSLDLLMPTIYFQLSPRIEDNDFRIEILRQCFQSDINIR